MLRKICWFVVCVTCMSVQGYDYTKASKKGSQNVPRSKVYITFCVLSSLIVIHHTEHTLRNTFCYFFIYQLPGILTITMACRRWATWQLYLLMPHFQESKADNCWLNSMPYGAPFISDLNKDASWPAFMFVFMSACLSIWNAWCQLMSADSLTVSFPLVFRVVLSLERAVYLPAIRASAPWRNRVSFFRLHWHQLQFYHSLTSFKCSKF